MTHDTEIYTEFGNAVRSQRSGQGFESPHLHQINSIT